MRRPDSARISGCSSASRRAFSSASENTRSRMRLRSIAPDASTNARPKSRRTSGTAAPPGPVSSWAMASVSTTVAPSRPNSSAAALLPLPMPPVRPMTRLNAPGSRQVPAHDWHAPEHGDDSGYGEVGTEMETESAVPAAPRGDHLRAAEGQADNGRNEDHERQHLPTEESADRRAHLEVSVAHALPACEQPESPVNGPQRKIAGRGADYSVEQGHEGAGCVQQQTGPQQRQGDVVRKIAGGVVNEGERDRAPDEEHASKRRGAKAEMPGRPGGAQAAEQLDQRVARADLPAATGALAAQREPARDRHVLDRLDAAAAAGATRTRHDQVVGFFLWWLLPRNALRFSCRNALRFPCHKLGAVGAPGVLHHERQAMDHHVEERADAKPDTQGDPGENGRLGKPAQINHEPFLDCAAELEDRQVHGHYHATDERAQR